MGFKTVDNYSSFLTGNSQVPILFHLPATHPNLPVLEIKAILESEAFAFAPIHEENCIFLALTTELAGYRAALRAAYCRRAIRVFFESSIPASVDDLVTVLRQELDFNVFLSSGETFLVRAYHVGNFSKSFVSIDVEKKVGHLIWTQLQQQCKVSMENPVVTFVFIFSDEKVYLGIELFAQPKGSFTMRRPDRRPFFKPGTLDPRFARLMVNLSRARPDGFLLDPFCGPGGILVEGAIMGCNVIGSDISKKMLFGARRNVRHFSPKGIHSFIAADAKKLPFIRIIDAVATDPPYGRSTSTYGKEIEKLIQDFLFEMHKVLVPKGAIAIGMFDDIPLAELVASAGFELIVSETIYIHKSLTRRIGVCTKK